MHPSPPPPRLVKLPAPECPALWIRLSRNRHPAKQEKINDPVVPLESFSCGRRLAGLLWERKVADISLEKRWTKYKNVGNVFYFHRKANLFLSINVDDIKNGTTQRELSAHVG